MAAGARTTLSFSAALAAFGTIAPSSSPHAILIVSICVVPDSDASDPNSVARATTWRSICGTSHSNLKVLACSQEYGLWHVTKWPAALRKGPLPRAPPWFKVPAMAAALRVPNAEFAFWLDSDALFTPFAIQTGLRPMLPQPPMLATFGADVGGGLVNSGAFALRRDPDTLELLRRVWAVYPSPIRDRFWEQGALIFLLTGSRAECREELAASGCLTMPRGRWANVSVFLPRPTFDARVGNPQEQAPDGFEPGVYAVHYTMLSHPQRATTMLQTSRRYLHLIRARLPLMPMAQHDRTARAEVNARSQTRYSCR